MKRPITLLLCAVLAGAVPSLADASDSTFFEMLVSCPDGQQPPEACSVSAVARFDLQVSPSAQKVAWKRTSRDGNTTFETGTNCSVVGDDDFSCEELTESAGTLRNTPPGWFPSRLEDHLISALMWYTSLSIDLGDYNLLARTVASVLVILGTLVALLIAWITFKSWLDRPSPANAALDKKRKTMGYD